MGKPRILVFLFRRDPSKDRQHKNIHFEGYQLFWPDRRPVATGIDSLCGIGQKLLGLGRHLNGRQERLLELKCYHLESREDGFTRIPGLRVRRFMIKRQGTHGRIHFIDRTPTEIVFQFGRDEPSVLHWIGLTGLRDGEERWFDLAACPTDMHVPARSSFAMASSA